MLVARSFLGGEFAGGESAWWRSNWIPILLVTFRLFDQIDPKHD